MGLLKLNDILIDVTKISYIGKPDNKISHLTGLNSVSIPFFEVVVDGHLLKIEMATKEDLLKVREKLVDQLTLVEGYSPG